MINKEGTSSNKKPDKHDKHKSDTASTILIILVVLLVATAIFILIDFLVFKSSPSYEGDCKPYEEFYQQSIFFKTGYCRENFDEGEWVCIGELFAKYEYFEKEGLVITASYARKDWESISIEGSQRIEEPQYFKDIRNENCDQFVKIKRRIYKNE